MHSNPVSPRRIGRETDDRRSLVHRLTTVATSARLRFLAGLFSLGIVSGVSWPLAAERESALVLFVAGTKSHAPGAHEFPLGSQLLADALNQSGLPLKAEVSLGWPEDGSRLERADLVVLYSDGLDRHVAAGKADALRRRFEAGKGLAVLHFALEAPVKDTAFQALLMDAVGGRFEAGWSVNPIWTLSAPPTLNEPVTSGVGRIEREDEWYFHLRFREKNARLNSLLQALPPASSLGEDGPRSGNPAVRAALADGKPQIVAWTTVAPTGARGFGFTGGHFHRNWYDDNIRRLVLNAFVWGAGLDVPPSGVTAPIPASPVYATLDESIARGDLLDVKRHLVADPSKVNGAAGVKLLPLHQAILRKKAPIAEYLLASGASATAPDSSGRSPLHMAVERADAALVTVLLRAHADPSVRDGRGWTPLHHAAAKNQIEIARLLLDGGTDPNILSELGGTPLHEAAVSGSVALIQLFLDRGTNPSIRSKPGVTALDIAREYKNAAVVSYLETLTK